MSEAIKFEDFLMEVDSACLTIVLGLHEYLMEQECAVKIESAKSGYVVSYSHSKTKKVIANYVFRKKGLIIRIYGDHVSNYMDFVNTLPESMVREIEKAPVCKRLIDPTKCNSRCPMGYVFDLKGTEYKKCRYNSFMFLVNDESGPFIKTFLAHELAERSLKKAE